MGRHSLATAILAVSILAVFSNSPTQAQDLQWQVENPFRFFKSTRSFALHEAAYNAARGKGEMPRDVVWRTERRLNDPDCRDSSTPDRCAATAGKRYQQSRIGWAAQTLGDVCYDRNSRPRRYTAQCERTYSWGKAREDYVLPEAHTVTVWIPSEKLEGVSGECSWTWRPRRDGGKVETKKQACGTRLTIARVPYARDAAVSGVSVAVMLPNGTQFSERNVVVEDIFVVALGDSFASGESNPDKPVQFSPSREMVYDPTLLQDEVARGGPQPEIPHVRGFGLSSSDPQVNPKVLPRRLMEDELAERFLRLSSPEFRTYFDRAQAQWLSNDCHRSQYGYPVRVGLQLALENRHRSVTFATFTCSGAEVTNGLFLQMDPRQGFTEPNGRKVRAQLDQLTDLLCRSNARQQAAYTLPTYATGSTSVSQQQVTMSWCPPNQRKRPIDVVLMSIGGNDVGFGGLVAYAMTESAADFAPVAAWIGSSIRFSPQVSRVYLNVLDERMKALKEALNQGFGIEPARVLQTTYEPIQYDENGQLCGAQPTLGMDVHPGLNLHRGRLKETADFLDEFLGRLECIAGKGRNCPGGLATGASGTGFRLITDHVPEFTRRGMCARDPKRALADGINMRVPRRAPGGEAFRPYSPAATLPYARHWRLFRTPNDAFLTAHTHREGVSVFDILQPAYAGLYSGAIHPTAEAHAIVADYVVRHARGILDKTQPAARAASAQ
jgi:hypothetical protein